MILSPDDRLPHGPARWSREALAEAWASCRRDLRDALQDPEVLTVAVLVGVPASGKSTWSREHDGEPGLVIFDACWANRGRRRGIAHQIRRAGKTAVAVWVQCPLDVCRERNAARPPETRVPDVALARAWVSLRHEPPVMAEGWSRVLVQDGQAERVHDAAVPPSRQLERLANAPANQAWALVRSRLLPAYSAAQRQASARPEAPPPRVAKSLRGIGRALERGQAGDEALARGLQRIGERVELVERRSWQGLVREQVPDFVAEPQAQVVGPWAERLAGQLQDVRQRIAPGLEASVAEAWRKGWSAAELERHWKEHGIPLAAGGTAEGRGSVLGASANAKIVRAVTQAHQEAVGADTYIWGPTSSLNPDPEHARRRGRRFKWSDPVDHPGERHGCHCRAIPVLSPGETDLA